ncbi:MAG TPA: hypothetical protein VEL51_24010 [Vicinamibacterales bacterium]|nr:hypothetical protein [Vicinamibacterales bacterium]
MRKTVCLTLSAALCAATLAAGCGRKQENEPAVATPSLSLSKDRVPIGSAITLTYKFVLAPNATFDRDYWVFVHVLDPEGEQMWTDDHLPPTPTSRWKAGETIEYKRTIFVPNYPYIGEAHVRLGLYDQPSGKRLVLNAQDVGRREYLVTKFQILASSERIFLIYKDGWHPAEVDAKNPQSEWQWTKKTATLSFHNPKKDSTLFMQYDARVDLFTPPQQVVLKIGDQVVGQFAAEAKVPTLITLPLTAAQLGPGEMVDLVLDVDRTFKPGGTDPRELGIRVFNVHIEPK